MNVSSSSARPSSTFWIIDTTSVSGTFTTTATFTLWVPLNTHSTTPATVAPSAEPAAPRSNTPVIVGSVIGSVLGASLVFACLVLYYKRRIRRTIVQPRTKPPDTPYGSEHALLDLTTEPAPHPEHIEPWVAPAVVRRSTKARDEAIRSQAWSSSAPRVQGSAVQTEILGAAGSTPQSQSLASSTIRRPSPQVQPVEIHSSATPSSTNHGHDPTHAGPSQPQLHLHQPEVLAGTKLTVPRRRAPREPSPPRQEQDAGVSLMRAGDDALPPSYGDLVHEHPR